MSSTQRLESYLETLASTASPGDRVPTVRQLMAEFGVSQAVVQRATERLKAQGRISAEVGRGTFFVGEGGASGEDTAGRETNRNADQKSVLFLRPSTRLKRGRRVLERLHSLLQDHNYRVVEVAYTDARDALDILRNLPRFNACVIQSTFETITIDMLAAVKRKTSAIILDGAVLAGTEVDAVGIEWGSAVELAIDHLKSHGHARIGLVKSTHYVLAAELGRIWFEKRTEGKGKTRSLVQVPAWPQEDYAAKAAEMIDQLRDPSGKLTVSAVIVWGIEDARDFVAQLAKKDVKIPHDLSVVLLGRTDLESETAGFFTTAGVTTEDQATALFEAIQNRWENPDGEYGIRFLPLGIVARLSVTEC